MSNKRYNDQVTNDFTGKKSSGSDGSGTSKAPGKFETPERTLPKQKSIGEGFKDKHEALDVLPTSRKAGGKDNA